MTASPFLLFAAIALRLGGSARGETVWWDITLHVAGGAVTGLSFALAFPGDADGETEFSLPDDWGGENQLYLGLSDIAAKGAASTPGDDPASLRLTHAPGADITLTWQRPAARRAASRTAATTTARSSARTSST